MKERTMKRILDLGCGEEKLSRKELFPDYNFEGEVIGLDLNKTKQTDVIFDLNKGYLPFKKNYFDIVYTSHCLEHIEKVISIIVDIHRVLKKGGYFLIRVPHVSYIDSMADLTHIRLFGYSSLNFLIQGNHAQLKNKERFKLIKRKIVFGRFYSFLGIEYLANRFPNIYNCFFEGIFTAREMHWELMKK